MYLGRVEPLGPHKDAVRHVIQARGVEQLFDRSQLALWQVALQRLQTRQIMFHELSDHDQTAWLSKLNIDHPDIHIYIDVQQMIILSFAARKWTTRSSPIASAELQEVLEQTKQRVHSILARIGSMEEWMSDLTGSWRPHVLDAENNLDLEGPFDFGQVRFRCPQYVKYHDAWRGSLWIFHAASQIVLRESLIDLIKYGATLQERQEPDADDEERLRVQRNAVADLCGMIIRSYPGFLGVTTIRPNPGLRCASQGQMIGRFNSLFSLSVVQMAKSAPSEHKETASKVIAWIHSNHGLG